APGGVCAGLARESGARMILARWWRSWPFAASAMVLGTLLLSNLIPLLAGATPLAAPCDPRPPINVSVVNVGERQLRVTVTVTTNASMPTNQLASVVLTSGSSALTDIPWERSGSAPPVYHPSPGAQTYTFLLTLAANASEATPVLTFFDACGPWQWFGGGG